MAVGDLAGEGEREVLRCYRRLGVVFPVSRFLALFLILHQPRLAPSCISDCGSLSQIVGAVPATLLLYSSRE